jgi:uncharacterized protein
MPIYFDTSALVKRYDARESGAASVQAFFAIPQTVFTSVLTPIEIMSAFRTKQRTGAFSGNDLNAAITDFRSHSPLDYTLIQAQTLTLNEAERLVLTYKIRAYDAVHVATALTIVQVANIDSARLEFYTGDQDQAVVAQAEGLTLRLI